MAAAREGAVEDARQLSAEVDARVVAVGVGGLEHDEVDGAAGLPTLVVTPQEGSVGAAEVPRAHHAAARRGELDAGGAEDVAGLAEGREAAVEERGKAADVVEVAWVRSTASTSQAPSGSGCTSVVGRMSMEEG